MVYDGIINDGKMDITDASLSAAGVPVDCVAAHFDAEIYLPGGLHNWFLESDDGAIMWVDDIEKVAVDGVHPP